MKNYMKKIIAGLLSLMVMFEITGVQVRAAGTNTSVPTAEIMFDNTKCVNTIEDNGSKYYYKWTASKSGVVNFLIERNDFVSAESASWCMCLYDSRMNKVDSKYNIDSGKTQSFTVQSGDIFYLEISSGSGAYTKVAYLVMANFTPVKYVEKESNDSGADATKLEISKEYIGLLSSSSDVDFYKLTAKQSGYFTIYFDRYDYSTTDDARWYFQVCDSKLNKLYEINTRENKDGLSLKYVLEKGKSIYIKISNYGSAAGVLYKVKASFKACNNIEKETNDEFSAANKLKIGTTYYGVLAEKTDDFFIVKPTTSGNYKLIMSLSSDIEYAQAVSVYDSSHNLVQSSGKIYKSGSLKFKAKKGKKYYIKISHAEGGFFGGYNIGSMYKLKMFKVK